MTVIRFATNTGVNSIRCLFPVGRCRFATSTHHSNSHKSIRILRPEVENIPKSSSSSLDSKSTLFSYSIQSTAQKPFSSFIFNNSSTFNQYIPFKSSHSNQAFRPLLYLKRSIYISSRQCGPDPYSILGVDRDSSSHDIKKRYRELAKQYHPDLNPGPEASSKMAAISSAYQILSDPKQKQFYDQTGMSPEEAGINSEQSNANPFSHGFGGSSTSFMFTDFTNFFADAFGGRGAGHVHNGEDIATEVTLDFLEAAKGCRKAVHLHANSSCGDCKGTGCSPGTSMSTCHACSGTGTQKIERGPIIFGTVCSQCVGSGQIAAHPCRACKGSGIRSQPRAVDLDFPAGIRSGMELRINGQGHAGVRGGRSGDLFVKVNVRPHAQFKLVQNDVHINIPLTLKQCLLGGEVFVPTLDGKLKLVVAPGTSPGDIKILRGKGIKKIQDRGFGDIAVHWGLEVPSTLTERQKELIEEFDRIQFGINDQHSKPDDNNIPKSSTSQSNENVFSSSKSSSVNGKNYGRSSSVPPPQRPPGFRKSSLTNNANSHQREMVEEVNNNSDEVNQEFMTDEFSSSNDEIQKVNGQQDRQSGSMTNNNNTDPPGFSPKSWFNKKFPKMKN